MIRSYAILPGDVMITTEKLFKKEFPQEQFMVLESFKYIKWYNPFSWFKKYYKIQYKGIGE